MTRSERKKRRAERVVIDTNLPENRRVVREAIKSGKLDRVKEDQIDPLEVRSGEERKARVGREEAKCRRLRLPF